jgi:predicted metal-dependent phosphoesterase TrpH
MYKIDFHTHSVASPDGSIRPDQYEYLLLNKKLDYIAITDHNRIDMAERLRTKLGEKIIIGEEIMTTEGEVVGLFLSALIKPHQSLLATVKLIKDQGGIVYIPHPFETVRHGISQTSLDAIAEYVDIVEVHNGRAVFQNRGPQAAVWAKINYKARAASSDAHGLKGIGRTFTAVHQPINAHTVVKALGKANLSVARPPLTTLLYPKINRLRKGLHR